MYKLNERAYEKIEMEKLILTCIRSYCLTNSVTATFILYFIFHKYLLEIFTKTTRQDKSRTRKLHQ